MSKAQKLVEAALEELWLERFGSRPRGRLMYTAFLHDVAQGYPAVVYRGHVVSNAVLPLSREFANLAFDEAEAALGGG